MIDGRLEEERVVEGVDARPAKSWVKEGRVRSSMEQARVICGAEEVLSGC